MSAGIRNPCGYNNRPARSRASSELTTTAPGPARGPDQRMSRRPPAHVAPSGHQRKSRRPPAPVAPAASACRAVGPRAHVAPATSACRTGHQRMSRRRATSACRAGHQRMSRRPPAPSRQPSDEAAMCNSEQPAQALKEKCGEEMKSDNMWDLGPGGEATTIADPN